MLDLDAAPRVTYLKDYMPSAYAINAVDLIFELDETATRVTARFEMVRNSDQTATQPLILSGDSLELISVKLNETLLLAQDYEVSADRLCIPKVPNSFTLEIITRINPRDNTALSGLYVSKGIFCTQCEAEGFRRITYFLDRPDVMARYKTTIIADKTRYPVLLSNGNPIAQGELENNQHWITWEDPFKKPSYLFALVAGNLECLDDKFITYSGREVVLKIFVEPGQIDKCTYAMECVKQAMCWDEIAYGREYDLDIFMIAAISDFNMGAMENKGLNIFNAKYILVQPETATDFDYQHVLMVVGHEYFHNWTGDRITCRDWFQLSLKEGLTVFREQEFSADTISPAVACIERAKYLRNVQFKEDAGPLAHPVQPQSYIEINNFYTATIYNKGAEVIRMLKTLLGPQQFRAGMDLYFERHDGQAVTIEHFIKAFEETSHRDLKQFRLWYIQAGTPELKINSSYNPVKKTFTLMVKQSCPATPGQPTKQPFHLPLTIGLLDEHGRDLPLQLVGESVAGNTTRVLELKQETETFHFINVTEKPTPSLLRGFSAPVKLCVDYSENDLCFLLAHDSDAFNRWDAWQQLALRTILTLIPAADAGHKLEVDEIFLRTFQATLTSTIMDQALLAELLILPSENYIGEQMDIIDVDGIYQARQFVRRKLAESFCEDFLAAYQNRIDTGPYNVGKEAIGRRQVKNVCLSYLLLTAKPELRQLCWQQFANANNMTDVFNALAAFTNTDCPEREQALKQFYDKWQNDALVVDKWFTIQASSDLPDTLARVKALLQHPAFNIKNPNRVRSLVGAFCQNTAQFHAKSGEGYVFLTDQMLQLDKLNPITTSRLLQPLTFWRRYDQARQKLMREQLERIANTPGISKDTYEVVSKSLAS